VSPARFNGVPLTRRPWGEVWGCGEGEDPGPDRCGSGGGGVYRLQSGSAVLAGPL